MFKSRQGWATLPCCSWRWGEDGDDDHSGKDDDYGNDNCDHNKRDHMVDQISRHTSKGPNKKFASAKNSGIKKAEQQ